MVRKQNRQLNQRITIRCRLKPFNKIQTVEYIRYRTSKAGGAILIKNSALKAVYRNSGGIPRVINSIMRMALTIAYSKGNKIIKKSYRSRCLQRNRYKTRSQNRSHCNFLDSSYNCWYYYNFKIFYLV